MRKRRGDFFAIDRTQWHTACDLGLNAAVAYLVLARFTGKSQQSTLAGANAIETYTSISRHRAKAAIGALEGAGLISEPKGVSARRIVLPEAPDFIWLPNALVTGAREETPPVERVRQMQDVAALRLLADLYHAQNLASDGGVHWLRMRRAHERRQVARLGPTTVWGFERASKLEVFVDAEFLHPLIGTGLIQTRCERHRHDDHAGNGKCCVEAMKASVLTQFFPKIDTLHRLGLIAWVGHLVEGDSSTAEVIFPFDMAGAGERIESDVALAAHAAASTIIEGAQSFHSEKAHGLWLAPVPSHIYEVRLFDLARLRYRPRTATTLEWHHLLEHRCSQLLAEFQNIQTGAASAVALATSR